MKKPCETKVSHRQVKLSGGIFRVLYDIFSALHLQKDHKSAQGVSTALLKVQSAVDSTHCRLRNKAAQSH